MNTRTHFLKRSRNIGPPRTISPGLIRVLAHRFAMHHPIPIFRERAANIAIEAQFERIQLARTNRTLQRKYPI